MRASGLLLLTFILGCGDDPDPQLDADPQMDAQLGDAIDDRPITVTVYDDGTPATADTASVIYDGETVPLDGTGKATLAVGGGDVTVVWPDERRLLTIYAIAPGDELIAGRPTAEPSFNLVGEMSVTLATPLPTPASHEVDIGCASGGADPPAPTLLQVYEHCPATVDVVAFAYDAQYEMISYAVAADVPRTQAAVTPTPWRTDFHETTVTLPDNTETHAYYASAGTYSDGFAYSLDSGANPLRFPMGFGTSYEIRVDLYTAGVPGESLLVDRAATPPAAATYVAADFLGPVSAPSFAHGSISWTAPADVDGTLVVVTFYLASGAISSWQWELAVPPGVTSVALPALPAELADFLPGEHQFYGDTYAVESSVLSPSDFRAQAGTRWVDGIARNSDGLPDTGRIRVSHSELGE